MNYCSSCGRPVTLRVPPGDNRERHVCSACGTVHYQNPRIVAGCLVTEGDRVLLCRRAIEPRHGYWTLPAGFLENGETTVQGAVRETLEEAQARIDAPELYTLFNLPHINQVYMFFRGRLAGGSFAAGEESLEVDLFRRDQVPWDALAFPVVKQTLEYYWEDRERDTYPVRMQDIVRRPR